MEDSDPGYRAAREGAALHPVSRTVAEVRGRDRVRFLHNFATNDILHLASGRDGMTFGKGDRTPFLDTPAGEGCLTAFADRQGRMVGVAQVRMRTDSILLEMDPACARAVIDHLRRHVITEEVRIDETAPAAEALLLFGPRAREIVAALVPDPPVMPFHFIERGGVRLALTPLLDVPCYEITGMREAPAGATPCGEAAMEVVRVESGLPRWGVDMDSTHLPMEAGLDAAVSTTKGCYLGQEVLQRVRSYSEPPKVLRALKATGDELSAPGDAILAGPQEIGRVTSAVRSPLYRAALALGTVRKEHKAAGTILTIRRGERLLTAEVLPWPPS